MVIGAVTPRVPAALLKASTLHWLWSLCRSQTAEVLVWNLELSLTCFLKRLSAHFANLINAHTSQSVTNRGTKSCLAGGVQDGKSCNLEQSSAHRRLSAHGSSILLTSRTSSYFSSTSVVGSSSSIYIAFQWSQRFSKSKVHSSSFRLSVST